MKNKFKKIIVTAVSVLSVSMLPLSGPASPTPYPPESLESESGEEPGGGEGCKPLNDDLELDHFGKICSAKYLFSLSVRLL